MREGLQSSHLDSGLATRLNRAWLCWAWNGSYLQLLRMPCWREANLHIRAWLAQLKYSKHCGSCIFMHTKQATIKNAHSKIYKGSTMLNPTLNILPAGFSIIHDHGKKQISNCKHKPSRVASPASSSESCQVQCTMHPCFNFVVLSLVTIAQQRDPSRP